MLTNPSGDACPTPPCCHILHNNYDPGFQKGCFCDPHGSMLGRYAPQVQYPGVKVHYLKISMKGSGGHGGGGGGGIAY